MGRKLVVELADGTRQFLEQVPAENERQLQEQLKRYPELLPLGELGLVGPAVVVGRESILDSGRVDLVLLGNAGDLALVEFKTGPQNPDFRECLAQLLDYGSDLWGMTLEDFEARVALPYLNGPFRPPETGALGASLDEVLTKAWGTAVEDPVDWRERLQAQLRDGAFHYVAVAQRFTPSMLKTLQYLNSAMKSSRFSAVELIRFEGTDHAAFEARFMAGAQPVKSAAGTSKTALAGVDELLGAITDDKYRHCLQDLFEAMLNLEGLTVYWGTTGCSLRVAIPNRSPLSIGWIFPPGPPRWMGLTDLTLGWYEDASGIELSGSGRAALDEYSRQLAELPGASEAKPAAIRGRSFAPSAVVSNAVRLEEAVRSVVSALLEN